MIPILAAASALNLLEKIGDGASSAIKHLTAAGSSSSHTEKPDQGGSFAAHLATQVAKIM